MSEKKGKVLGIDLGTTNSCMAISEGRKIKIIENSEGARITPSCVAYVDGRFIVGNAAKRQAHSNPKNTVYEVKRLIGRRYDELSKTTISSLPYKVIPLENGDAGVEIEGQSYTPSYLSAMILQKMVSMAESYLGYDVKRVVITVPAYFNDAQRQATKEAGEIAGLTVERIINEPTAAALAYGFDHEQGGTVAVFDLGGGTFDISILEITKQFFEVKSTGGDTFLGGSDFDTLIVDWIVMRFKEANGIDLRADILSIYRVRESAEGAKKELSSSVECRIQIPFISGATHIDYTMTRAQFENMSMHLVEKTISICGQVVKEANITVQDINHVVLVGGMTRMPLVGKMVEKFFNKTPARDINPDEAVAYGAAIQGGVIEGDIKDVLLLDVTPLSLGVETLGGVFTKVIEKNTTIPASDFKLFTTAEDGQTTVSINVLQGERALAQHNKHLGRFDLTGIAPAPKQQAKIRVNFDIDTNGIITITATDEATGKKQAIQVAGNSGATKEEIEQMKKDAERLRDEDEKMLQVINTKNSIDSKLYDAGKKITKLETDQHTEAKTLKEKFVDLSTRKNAATELNILQDIEKEIDSLLESINSITPVESSETPTETVNPTK